MIQFDCHCGAALRSQDEFAGDAGECPNCGNALKIPVPPGIQSPQNLPVESDADPSPAQSDGPVPLATEVAPATISHTATPDIPAAAGSSRRSRRRPDRLLLWVWVISAVLIVGAGVGIWYRLLGRGARSQDPVSATWYVAETLPLAGRLGEQLTLSDAVRGSDTIYLVVEADVSADAAQIEPVGEEWQYILTPVDSILEPAQGPAVRADGIRIDRGFQPGAGLTQSQRVRQKPKRIRFGVYFQVDGSQIEPGEMTYRYRRLEPIRLTKGNQK